MSLSSRATMAAIAFKMGARRNAAVSVIASSSMLQRSAFNACKTVGVLPSEGIATFMTARKMNVANARSFSSLPDHIKLEMPNLSPTMEKGNLGAWNVKIGDKVGPGDVLCSIETDKATVDFEMQDEGYVAAMLYEAGTKDIPLGKILAVLVEEEDDIAAFKDFKGDDAGSAPAAAAPKAAAPEPAKAAATPAAAPTPSAAPSKPAGGRIFASPLAQNIANQQNVNLAAVKGTGPGGRIIKADVLEAGSGPSLVSAPAFATAPGSQYVDLTNSQIRKVIADRLTYSKQNIPHYYVTVQVQVDNLMKLRAKLNKVSKVKLSVNDFVMKAASMAAIKVPETNSSWQQEFVRQFSNVNMSFAVQTDHGLMAPTVNNVNLKGLEQISSEVKDIAGRARENKLKPEELSGGTFTVSNLGMYGVHNFSAIINPPQACILAVGGAFKQVVVNENAEGDDRFSVAHMMNVTLSSDHRVVDGAVAAMWGQEFKKFIENPELMLL